MLKVKDSLKTEVIEKLEGYNLTLVGLTPLLELVQVFEDEDTSWVEVEGRKESYPNFILWKGIQAKEIKYNGGTIEILGYLQGLTEICNHDVIESHDYDGSESAYDYTDTYNICTCCGKIVDIKKKRYNY
jgi:hypothetical protein